MASIAGIAEADQQAAEQAADVFAFGAAAAAGAALVAAGAVDAAGASLYVV
jgi:hypothetical protein